MGLGVHYFQTHLYDDVMDDTLWLFHIAMEAMALIEIDGLPVLKMGGFSMAL